MAHRISVIIPTLNSSKVIKECLDSIAAQDYPKELLEIVVVDGGSSDGTLEIARKYTGLVFENPLKTGEAGKSVGIRRATGDILAFIDSDNALPSPDWLNRMIEPFSDAEIIATEPLEYTFRKTDGFITRYCALLGMNDPLCLFLGNYDRLSHLTGKWTGIDVDFVDEGSYLKLFLDPKSGMPTIGANGFFIRAYALRDFREDYFFDVDVLYGFDSDKIIVAKVKEGIIHNFCGSDIGLFFRKQKRRVKDFLYYQNSGKRKYPWKTSNRSGLAKFIVYSITVLPLVFQSGKGYLKRSDSSWAFHPLACWITLFAYGTQTLISIFSGKEESREGWRQ